MKPLLLLVTVFIVSMLVLKQIKGDLHIALSARIGMSAMLLFTAVGHFVFSKGMAMMLPEFIPFKKQIIYATGIIELITSIGLLIPKYQVATAWLVVIFFILILPANIYASMKHIDYQKATFEGPGLNYLLFRIPLQLIFIIWTYVSGIKK